MPSRYAEQIPPGGSLYRYARQFNAVEINSSFYRPHRRQTYERWAASTPAGFLFSVKTPKVITHELRLSACESALDQFFAEVAGLGDKLGVLLVQLPPKLAFDERAVDLFLQSLQGRTDALAAVEPRHSSWFAPGIEGGLADRRVARVAADPAPFAGADKAGGWTGLTYYRLHGSPRRYYSAYDATALASLKLNLDESRARGIPTWCIFDNTASGEAFGNALELAASVV